MPFTAWKHTERNRQRDKKKYVMISWGFVIPAVQNNSLNDSTYIAFFRAYLATILKALQPPAGLEAAWTVGLFLS